MYVQPDESDGIVELTFVPKEIVKKKPVGIMDLMGGNLSQIAGEIGGMQQRESKIYINFNQYLNEFKNQILSDVLIDISIVKLAEDIAKGK